MIKKDPIKLSFNVVYVAIFMYMLSAVLYFGFKYIPYYYLKNIIAIS